MAAMVRGLPSTIGEGEHVQPLMVGVLQGMRELTMKVQDLEGMMYVGWEGPVNWAYADKCFGLKKEYGVACQKAAGTKVGHIKNHLLMGLYAAFLEDKSVPDQQKQELEDILGPLYRDSAGKISSANAQRAHKA